MVMVHLPESAPRSLAQELGERGIRVLPAPPHGPMRLVTHLDVSADDVAVVIEAFGEVLSGRAATSSPR
jgi:threonine aldolase